MYKLKTLSVLVTAIAFAACDAGVQDGGGTDTRSGMKGLVVDGLVANGRVWADRDNDNEIDDFEPFAFTDSEGFYSYNPNTQVDYCASTDEALLRHCLKYGSSDDSVTIRVRGGIDLDTGEPLKGVMSMATTISDSEQTTSTPPVLSPLTTLLERTPADKRARLQEALGIEAADLRKDFTSEAGFDAGLYATAVALQTMIDVASEAGDADEETQISIIDKIAEKFIERAEAAGAGTSVALTDLNGDDIAEVLGAAGVPANKLSSVRDNVVTLKNQVATLAQSNDSAAAKTRVKALEVVSKLVKEDATGDSDLSGKLATIVSNLGSLESAIGSDDVDINSLANAIKDADSFDANDISSVTTDSKLEDLSVGGNWFVFRPDRELAADVSGAENYIAAYFFGDNESTTGDFSMCVNVNPTDPLDDEAPDVSLAYYGGTWNKITDSSITLIIDYNGQEFEGLIKAKAKTQSGVYEGDPMKEFRLSSDLAEDETAIVLLDPAGDDRLGSEQFSSKNDTYCSNIHAQIVQTLSSAL